MANWMPAPEFEVWKLLKKQHRNRWLPQYPVLAFKKWYILDFYLKDARLAVEIDGPDHDAVKDDRRDLAVRQCHGIKTVRFTNQQAMEDPWGIICEICKLVPRSHR